MPLALLIYLLQWHSLICKCCLNSNTSLRHSLCALVLKGQRWQISQLVPTQNSIQHIDCFRVQKTHHQTKNYSLDGYSRFSLTFIYWHCPPYYISCWSAFIHCRATIQTPWITTSTHSLRGSKRGVNEWLTLASIRTFVVLICISMSCLINFLTNTSD